MSEAERAVGAPRASVVSLADIRRVDGRVDALEAKVATGMQEIHAKLDEVLLVIGKPASGAAHPPSGLFDAVASLDIRLKPFEKLWQRGVGFAAAASFIGVPLLVALWWLAGDKIGHFFHG